MPIVQPIVHKQPMGLLILKLLKFIEEFEVPYGNPGFVFLLLFPIWSGFCFFRYKCKGLEGDELQSDFYKNFVWNKVYLIEEYLWNSYWCNECGAVVDEGGVEAGWAFRPFGDWDKKIEVTFTKVDEQLKRAERVLPFLRGSPNGRFRSSSRASTLT